MASVTMVIPVHNAFAPLASKSRDRDSRRNEILREQGQRR